MKDIESIQQIETTGIGELEKMMKELCERYVTVVPTDKLARPDYSKLIVATALPLFAFEVMLKFISAMLHDETSGDLEEAYRLDYFGLLGAIAQNQTTSAHVLEQIVNDVSLCDRDTSMERERKIALSVLRHPHASPDTICSLLEGGWECCKKRFFVEGCELIAAGIRHANVSIERALQFRVLVVREAYELQEEDEPLLNSLLEIIDSRLVAKGYRRWTEAPQEGYPYRQLRMF